MTQRGLLGCEGDGHAWLNAGCSGARPYKDVIWFDITVDVALSVHVLEPARDVQHDLPDGGLAAKRTKHTTAASGVGTM